MITYTQRYKTHKYRAKKTEYNGYRYDSKLEASQAIELDIRLKAGEIKDWERQFKIEIWAYDCHGNKAIKKTHKVDFRVHELDGNYTLIETKGFETPDYLDRKKWLLKLWLPEHPDHNYLVIRSHSLRRY